MFTICDENDDVLTRVNDGARAEFHRRAQALAEAEVLSRTTADMLRVYEGLDVIAIAYGGVVYTPAPDAYPDSSPRPAGRAWQE